MAIQQRRGNKVDFNPSKMLPGEWAVALDTETIWMCVAPGRCIELGSASTLLPLILEAEAWAAGTKDGEPVESSDPQYHNNAKYYAENAEVDCNDAEAWAVGKINGEDVPSTDPRYHNNAKYWADQAASSSGTAPATPERLGVVKPDNETITVDEDGTIHGASQINIVGKGVIIG